MPIKFVMSALAAAALLINAGVAYADGSGDPKPVKNEDGKYYDKNGNPTYNIGSDGKVEVYLFGIPPLPFRMPRLPRTQRRWLELCARTENVVDDDELF